MQQIEIDFEVYKALTAQRKSESHTYNDVLRELLKLPPPSIEIVAARPVEGRLVGGRFLPNGTMLRAKYKGAFYLASIKEGEWVSDSGEKYESASAAARGVTNNSVNGLTFWEAKRPSDSEWITLKSVPKRLRRP
jgi:hypothetical protein